MITKNIGFILLAIYLLLIGISQIIPAFILPSIVYGIIAFLAGIFILINR